jgi:magnesium-transporting ATPase (P-type)
LVFFSNFVNFIPFSINVVVGVLLVLLCAVCIALSIMRCYDCLENDIHLSYVGVPCEALWYEFLSSFARFLIIFHNVVPVSLLATVQMVRLVHAYFIQHDWDIYSDTFDKTASVRNSKLNEMMGQGRGRRNEIHSSMLQITLARITTFEIGIQQPY